MQIIGVDASVSKTGVVTLHGEHYSGHIITSKRADPGRLMQIAAGATNAAVLDGLDIEAETLLVIEGLGQAIGNQRINIALHWMVRAWMADGFRSLRTLVVAPMSLKVFAVGRGGKGVGKSTVAGIMDKWPGAVDQLRLDDGELPAEDVLEALALVKVGECWLAPEQKCWTEKQRDVARLERLATTKAKRVARTVYDDGASVDGLWDGFLTREED